MGFAREARRVRDASLPHGQRLRALAHCLGWAQPVGFNPSWHYVEAELGTPHGSIEFLIPAIELLERERALHLELDQRYSTLRRLQKMRGSRSPRPDAVTPRSPARWHGDERQAAVHALRWWLQCHRWEDFVDHPEAELAIDVARVIASGRRLPSLDLTALQQSVAWARTETRARTKQTMAERRRAHQVLHLLGQIYIALNGAPVVGSPWNFVASPDDQASRAAVARTYLRSPLGFWRSSPQNSVDRLSDAAADLLVLGYDTPALRQLAGLSRGDSFYEVDAAVTAALDELEIGDLLDASADRAGLEARLGLFLDDKLTLRELSTWAHQVIGHEGEDDLQPFVMLDDIYDDWECAGQDLAYLDLVTRKAAHDFLAGRSVSRLDYLSAPDRAAAYSVTLRRPSWRERLRRRGRSAQ